jgi:hypothetical protein
VSEQHQQQQQNSIKMVAGKKGFNLLKDFTRMKRRERQRKKSE